MIVKDTFNLSKGIPNVLNLPDSTISKYTVRNDIDNMVRHLQMIESQINHFSKKLIMKEFSNSNIAEKKVHILNIPKYPFPVTYNIPTKKIVINLSAFSSDEITRIDGKTVYGALAYGLCFKRLVTGEKKIGVENFGISTSFLTTVLIRIFGKEYGLLGIYTTKIPALKFLLSCYILKSFFGIQGEVAYKKSHLLSPYDYRSNISKLDSYDFSNIEDFIKSLSDFKVMPGLSKYNFASKLLRFLDINFLPAMEDMSRFFSTMLASNIGGANLIKSFIYTFNPTEFSKILEILKKVMK